MFLSLLSDSQPRMIIIAAIFTKHRMLSPDAVLQNYPIWERRSGNDCVRYSTRFANHLIYHAGISMIGVYVTHILKNIEKWLSLRSMGNIVPENIPPKKTMHRAMKHKLQLLGEEWMQRRISNSYHRRKKKTWTPNGPFCLWAWNKGGNHGYR